MLEMIHNIKLKPSFFHNQDHHSSNIIDELYLYQSIFKELKKTVLTKKIEFVNVITEEKKNDDKNIICTNFVINNLLNIFNNTNKDSKINHFNDSGIQNNKKKKISIKIFY